MPLTKNIKPVPSAGIKPIDKLFVINAPLPEVLPAFV